MAAGVTINRPPRDGHMAFIRSPDGISIELLQAGAALAAAGALGLDAQHGQLVKQPIRADFGVAGAASVQTSRDTYEQKIRARFAQQVSVPTWVVEPLLPRIQS